MSRRIAWKWKLASGVGFFFILLGAAAFPWQAATAPRAASGGEEFYIISSVDLRKDQLVLKRPTEVTVLMDVNDKTVVLDEKGKPLHLKDLRAGDTVFVTSRQDKDDTPVATRIRKGYMTLEEVRARYLRE
jgi:hypothetical protein